MKPKILSAYLDEDEVKQLSEAGPLIEGIMQKALRKMRKGLEFAPISDELWVQKTLHRQGQTEVIDKMLKLFGGED